MTKLHILPSGAKKRYCDEGNEQNKQATYLIYVTFVPTFLARQKILVQLRIHQPRE
jgi:hypothetical protein